MKKTIAKLLVCVLMTSMILTGCGNADKKECKEVLKEFQYACNNIDVNSMLDCMDPDIADPIRILISAAGADPTECLDMFSDILWYGLNESESGAEEVLTSLVIEPEEVEVEDNYAVVYCKMSCMADGVEVVRFADAEMKLHNDSWYIMEIYFTEER